VRLDWDWCRRFSKTTLSSLAEGGRIAGRTLEALRRVLRLRKRMMKKERWKRRKGKRLKGTTEKQARTRKMNERYSTTKKKKENGLKQKKNWKPKKKRKEGRSSSVRWRSVGVACWGALHEDADQA
jgi:hypothetical protein